MQTKTAFFKREYSIKRRFLFYCMFCVLLIYTDARFNYLEMIRTGVSIFIHPLRAVALLPAKLLNDGSELLTTASDLREQNAELRKANFKKNQLLLVQKSLLVENKNLRQLLDLRAQTAGEPMFAEIIFQPRDPFSRQVLVDKGATHGVELGAPAVDINGVLGQVVRVHPWTSTISLVTHRDHPVPVQVARNGLRAVVFGVGYDSSLEIRFLPVDADVREGDLLATSGIGGVYPPNLPVGMVNQVTRDDAFPFAKISVSPMSNIGSHKQVLLLSQIDNLLDNSEAEIENEIVNE